MDHGFANGVARHLEAFGKLALIGKQVAGPEAFGNLAAQHVAYLLHRRFCHLLLLQIGTLVGP